MFPLPASKQLGRTRANPGPRTVSLDLAGHFKHPLSPDFDQFLSHRR
jgi:hypothetical protein